MILASSGVKAEKPSTSSGITIRKVDQQKPSTSNVIKIMSPTSSGSGNKNVQVVRVLNTSTSPSTSSQKVIQVQRTSTAPRILNQSLGRQDIKDEPHSSEPISVVRKSVVNSDGEETSPPAKKTKYITLTTSQINQIEGATIMGGGKSKRIVMLPSNYREQLEKISNKPSQASSGQTTFKIVQEIKKPSLSGSDSFSKLASGKKSKRPCNCTKSQCLKFYCDCFAAGEYCSGCNCKDCLNEHDSEDRERAVKMCLERNPQAFKWVKQIFEMFGWLEYFVIGRKRQPKSSSVSISADVTARDPGV